MPKRRPSWSKTVAEVWGTRLPENWEPAGLQPQTIAYKIAAGWTGERFQREKEKFRSHWRAKAGKGALKLDWQQAWIMWILKADEIDKSGRHGWAS